ncbi:hypothetical protein [Campylobacter hyointestinalis]|uniref:hypothetical protein n=1 Tax=Campylobacter hyointestinalis TaxID=198 RepID=UPI0011617432|nr:hypothetical protein [Campylobacter hyointestinalis]
MLRTDLWCFVRALKNLNLIRVSRIDNFSAFPKQANATALAEVSVKVPNFGRKAGLGSAAKSEVAVLRTGFLWFLRYRLSLS